MPLSVALHTLGCKLNQYETEQILESFVDAGFQVVPFGEPADVVVINTCTVTGKTDHRSRGAIRRAVECRTPKPLVAVTGCFAEMFPGQVRSIKGVDLVVGNEEKPRLASEALRLLSRRGVETDFSAGLSSSDDKGKKFIHNFEGHTRAFVKVQDGCDNSCAYCIVTQARGPSRSRPADEVVREARGLAESGFKELVLVGVHLGAWGRDFEPPLPFENLIETVLPADPGFRLRLSSMEPGEITDNLIKMLSLEPRICPHLHIPLQSGSDAVLKRMNRGYDSAFFADRARKLVENVPGIAIGADVMVGFPGETESEFNETAQLIRDLPMTYLHVFSYSRRPGTAAASMPGQIAPEIKASRSEILRDLSVEKSRGFREGFIGKTRPVLIEKRTDPITGEAMGITDNYIKVKLKGGIYSENRIVELKLVGLKGKMMLAAPVEIDG